MNMELWMMLLLALTLWMPLSETAAVANTLYTMDQKSDCISPGILSIPRDQVTKLLAPSKETLSSAQTLSCRLQFSPESEGDMLKMTLESGAFFEDCDVSLEMLMTNNERIILGCKSDLSVKHNLEAINGVASVWLARRQFDDKSYWFQISITAVRSELKPGAGGAGSENVGLIAGIVTGVILLLVVGIIIFVCCYRKRHDDDNDGTKIAYNRETKASPFSSTAHGYENKLVYVSSEMSSPRSEKKLLEKNYQNDGNTRPRTALERFGPSPKGPPLAVNKKGDESKRDEGNKGEGKNSNRTENRSDDMPGQFQVGHVERSAQRMEESKNPSSLFSALQGNAKFRKSFHENEADAEERVRRVSAHSSQTNSSVSGDSQDLSANRAKLPLIQKSLSRSPSSPRQKEKTTGQFYSRPPSSSSESERGEHRKLGSGSQGGSQTLRSKDGRRQKPERKQMKKEKDEHSDDDRKEDRQKLRRKHHGQRDDEIRKVEEKKRMQREKDSRHAEDDDRSRKGDRDGEYEGRFKKSSSGRKPKNKAQRMGRSRSTGNALEDLDLGHQHSRSKSSGSVRSLVLADDDEDDLDSNYMTFGRSGSKTSLYASRSSLYGRRRKNSMGETVSMSSYAHDDVDSRMGDFDKSRLSHREKERLFRSTGDLEMSSASAVVFRECSTQTGSDREVYIYGRKAFAKGRPCKRYNHGTQTVTSHQRRDSAGSTKSGRSSVSNQRIKSRSRSQESLRKKKHHRSIDLSEEDSASNRSHNQKRSRSQNRDYDEKQYHLSSESDFDDDDDHSTSKSKQSKSRSKDDDHHRSKQKFQPESRPRRTGGKTNSEASGSDDERSAISSSTALSSQKMAQMPQFAPLGYPVVYPQPAMAYLPTAPGGPPVMVPVGSLSQSASQRTPTAPMPNVSKWDQLVDLTEGMKKRRHQMGESIETESVLSSWSQPLTYNIHPQAYYPAALMHYQVPDPQSTAMVLEAQKQPDVATHKNFYAPSDSSV